VDVSPPFVTGMNRGFLNLFSMQKIDPRDASVPYQFRLSHLSGKTFGSIILFEVLRHFSACHYRSEEARSPAARRFARSLRVFDRLSLSSSRMFRESN